MRDPGGDAATTGATGARRGRIQSVDRAAALLRAVGEARPGEATLAALAASCGLNRSTAWRILVTLEDQGFVERRGSAYALGVAVVQLASAATRDVLLRGGHRVLARLATVSGETASLAVARRSGLFYVDSVAASGAGSESWLGRHVPLHATSTGKAYLAWLEPDEVDDLLPMRLPAFTAATITDHAALRADLEATRARGYATCEGELERRWQGVAAPVLGPDGRPLGSIDLWGHADRVTVARFAALGELVVEGAREVAISLERS